MIKQYFISQWIFMPFIPKDLDQKKGFTKRLSRSLTSNSDQLCHWNIHILTQEWLFFCPEHPLPLMIVTVSQFSFQWTISSHLHVCGKKSLHFTPGVGPKPICLFSYHPPTPPFTTPHQQWSAKGWVCIASQFGPDRVCMWILKIMRKVQETVISAQNLKVE